MEAVPVTSDAVRRAMACFATGVVVVTANGPSGPVGMAVNSFTSVSLDPPLVLFCASRSSNTWPWIKAAGHFCANVLSAHQEGLARVFAERGDRYLGVAHHRGVSGAPVLDCIHAHVDCEIAEEHDAGDHIVVIGRVLDVSMDAARSPLLFYRSRYRRL
jgi:3-hydroxy-9,10-secoandrosta-1,3,5(10)-triene-9,17-dione monooxygenase reductase component